jgi:serine protease inhibitor
MTQRLLAAIIALSVMGSAAAPPKIGPAELAVSSNRFGFDLFRTLTAGRPGENVFISPYSVSTALTMAWGGARGATARDMARTLRFDGSGGSGVYPAAGSLRQSLASDTAVTMAIANSLWLRQGLELKPGYLAAAKKSFGAELSVLDFNDAASAGVINGWVTRATRGKIETIIERIAPDMLLYLINAIYFKASWQAKFDPARTREQDFFLADGTAKRRPLMRRSGQFRYLKGPDFQAVYLPYAGDRMGMYLFLPDRRDGIAAFLSKLSAGEWEQWGTQFTRRKGELALPRFKAEYKQELGRQLAALGMGRAFGGGADFSGMAAGGLSISEVIHKTFLEVNEEGSEAAAVTAVGLRTTAVIAEPPPFEMTVDHPFFLAIADRETGAILFMGAIADPD